MYRVWLQAEHGAGALSMHSIHSPDYVFTVLVSIFISKTHNHFLSTILVVYTGIYSKSDGVLCFRCSRTRIENDMYHVHTNMRMYVCAYVRRTYTSSTVSRHSGAEAETIIMTTILIPP